MNEELEKAIAQLRAIGATDAEVNAYIAEHKPTTLPKIRISGESTAASPYDAARRAESAAETPGQFGTGVLRSALGGMTLGGGDELETSARALGGADMGSTLTRVRAEKDKFRERHPVISRVAEAAGGAVPAAATLAFPPLAAANPAVGGALFGALYGAGESEGVHDLAKSTAAGSVVGAGMGAGMMAASAVGRPIYDVARAAARSTPLATAASSARPQSFRAPPGGSGTVGGAGGAPPPSSPPSVLRSFGPRTPSERGDALILRRLASDKVTIDDLERAAAGTHKPVSIMDLAGDNTKGVARGARSVPSEAKQSIPKAIYERAEGQGKRIRGDLESAAGTTPADLSQTDNLIATRRANATPRYEKAYNSPPLQDAAVAESMQLPEFQRAYRRAQRIAKAEDQDLPDFDPSKPIDIKTIDLVKRGMDDVIDGRTRAGKMGRTEARALRQRLDDVLVAADSRSPAYAEARGQFSSDSKSIEALELGRQFSKTDDREIGRVIAGLSAGDRELYLQGALDDLTQMIRSRGDNQDAVSLVFGSEEKRDALKALLGKDFDDFARHMGVEKDMLHTKRHVLGGSNTADKMAEQLDLDNTGLVEAAAQGAQGKFSGMRQSIMSSALWQRLQGLTEETANEIAPLLTAGMNGDKQALAVAIVRLRQAEQREAGRRVIRGTATRPFTGFGGGAAGNRFSDQKQP